MVTSKYHLKQGPSQPSYATSLDTPYLVTQKGAREAHPRPSLDSVTLGLLIGFFWELSKVSLR